MRKILAADLFCGMGGTSEGLFRAAKSLGVEVDLVAVNHWPRAIETHTLNHPEAQHFCTGLDVVDPRELVPGGRLDLLVASPECTHHSNARGGMPMSDQSRATAWCVTHWASRLEVQRIVVENVPEFRTWGPLDAGGRPIKRLKGALFRSWCRTLEELGYHVQHRLVNCADYGDPTTRKRCFVVASLGSPVVWPDPTHCDPKQLAGALIADLRPWRTAREIIDWSLEGKSVFHRKKPLAEKTLRRVFAGLARYSGHVALPHLIALRHYMGTLGMEPPEIPKDFTPFLGTVPDSLGRSDAAPYLLPHLGVTGNNQPRPLDAPLHTVTASHGAGKIVQPCLLPHPRASEPDKTDSVDEPMRTVTATSSDVMLAEPAIIVYNGNSDAASCDAPLDTVTATHRFSLAEPALVMLRNNSEGANLDSPVPAITAGGNQVGLAEPALIAYHNGDSSERRTHPVDDPVPTLDCSNRYALAQPVIVGAGGPSGMARPASVDEPLGTVIAANHRAVAEPVVVTVNHGNEAGKDGDTRRSQSVDAPLGAVTTSKGKAVVEPLILNVCHSGDEGRFRSVDQPVATVTTDRGLTLAQPVILPHEMFALDGADSVDSPLRTITAANGNQNRVVEPVLLPHARFEQESARSVDDPMPTITAVNGRQNHLAEPILVPNFGEREGQEPRAHTVDAPLPAVTSHGAGMLVTLSPGEEVVVDIRLRMLRPHELAAAMGMEGYKVTGTLEEQVRQIGNAVPANTAAALCRAQLAGLLGGRA